MDYRCLCASDDMVNWSKSSLPKKYFVEDFKKQVSKLIVY